MITHQKHLKTFSILLLTQTVIWLIFTAVSMSQVKPAWQDIDYIRWVANPDFFFTGNYINATLLTIVAVILFTQLFNFLNQSYKVSAITGFVFVPVYGVLNIACYSIQISIVPIIAKNTMNNAELVFLASQLIQANSNTLVGFLNGLAYAIFGIPSIIFGLLLVKEKKKWSGIFLSITGILCIIGIIGYMVDSRIIASGIMAGGIFFLISLVFMIIEFKFDK